MPLSSTLGSPLNMLIVPLNRLIKGGDEFYKGDIAKKLVDDIQKSGGIITMEDMKNYRSVQSSAFISIQRGRLPISF